MCKLNIANLTLSVPHFFDCGKNESTKAFNAYPFNFLTFGHSGTHS